MEKYNVVEIVALLKQKTGGFHYQMFFNSLLGMSPESIDSLILRERQKNTTQEL